MPKVDISDELWDQINILRSRFSFQTQADFMAFCLSAVETRYWPAVGAIVTREQCDILLVGNDYGRDELVWNLPGGAVDPGEDMVEAAARELYEETGIKAVEFGPLAWIMQVNLADKRPFIIGFAFEVTAWEGKVTLENEVDHGDVQQAAFVPFDEALECVLEGNRTALRDWLVDPKDVPRLYFSTPEGVRRVM